MTLKETLNKIAIMLSPFKVEEDVTVTFSTLKLEDGITTIEADSFEAGSPVFILTESEESIPMPIGVYKLEDGSILTVEEEGIIASIAPADAPVEDAPVEDAPVEAAEEDAPIDPNATDAPVEDVVQDVTREEFDALVTMVEEMKASLALSQEAVATKETEIAALKVSLSSEPASTKIKHTPDESNSENNNIDSTPKTKFDRILKNLKN